MLDTHGPAAERALSMLHDQIFSLSRWRSWALLALCVALHSPAMLAAEQNCRTLMGAAQVACLEAALQRAEARLATAAQATRRAMTILGQDAVHSQYDPQARFDQAQSAWRLAALADCDWLESRYLGGSLGRPSRLQCLIERVAVRQQELQALLENHGEPNPP